MVYESVGGEMFGIAVNALANKGRLIVIGMMSQYADGWQVATHPGLPEKLLKKSASVSGEAQRLLPPAFLLCCEECQSDMSAALQT